MSRNPGGWPGLEAERMRAMEDAWIRTYTGLKFYFAHPTKDMVDIEDIARSLSRQCRYNGHTRKFYSVAEHCVLLARFVKDPMLAYTLLMHDSAEAYIGDIPDPFKAAIGAPIREVEGRIERVLAKKYGFTYPFPPIVHELDHAMLDDERAQVMWGADDLPSPCASTPIVPAHGQSAHGIDKLGITLQLWSPDCAMQEFLRTFSDLTALIGGPHADL